MFEAVHSEELVKQLWAHGECAIIRECLLLREFSNFFSRKHEDTVFCPLKKRLVFVSLGPYSSNYSCCFILCPFLHLVNNLHLDLSFIWLMIVVVVA